MHDVEILLRVPVDGEPVIGNVLTPEEWPTLCQRLLGIVPEEGVDRKVSGKQNVGGAFILLQLWAWEWFPYVAPGRLGRRDRPPASPLDARVKRQFGRRQTIPDACNCMPVLHGKDWSAGSKDFRLDHLAEFEMWNNRLDHVVADGEADPHEYAYPADDPYVLWYERITLRYISRQGRATNTAV
ncbi:hypothetical protein RHGRI_026626 [Rhododendron griersonianum]|uniref:Aminotransferase-like plant mobile domain-containing protein n=1 Tax=Rhododendron griersonianum TaxID=479676 RepID=A0AAV6IXC4_9ERIC|nr:hypothetical protein RHGRI_026626 [Rhododendron griersonianum]